MFRQFLNVSPTANKNLPLEGIRAISVFLVLLVHAGFPLAGVGWIGVDIFFVLSGFLITTLLLKEYGKTENLKLGRFWMRRFLRLMPAYLLYISIITFLVFMSSPNTIHSPAGWTITHYLIGLWTYTINYIPFGGIWDHQQLTVHLWSLAVEEQFYFILPPLLLIGLRTTGSATVTIVLILVAFLVLTLLDLLPGRPSKVLETRGMALIVGCLIASVYLTIGSAERWQQRLGTLHKLCIFGSIAVFVIMVAQTEVGGLALGQILVSTAPGFLVCIGITIAGYWYGHSTFGTWFLSRPFMTFTGHLSYGLYLYHMAAWMIVWRVMDPAFFDWMGQYPAYGVKLLIYFGLSYVFAIASFGLVERRFQALKDRKFR